VGYRTELRRLLVQDSLAICRYMQSGSGGTGSLLPAAACFQYPEITLAKAEMDPGMAPCCAMG